MSQQNSFKSTPHSDQDVTLSTKLGRKWLADSVTNTQDFVSGGQLASESVVDSQEDIKVCQTFVSISIPDVASHRTRPIKERDSSGKDAERQEAGGGIIDRKMIAEAFAEESDRQLRSVAMNQPISQRPQPTHQKQAPREIDCQEERLDESIEMPPITTSKTAEKVSTQPTADPRLEDTPKASSAPTNPSQWSTTKEESQLTGIVESILNRTTNGQSAVLLFVGTQENSHIDSTAAGVASILSKQRLGKVLLIDCYSQTKSLSRASGASNQHGIVEAVLDSVDWKELICKGAASGVDFLPHGKKAFDHGRYQAEVRTLVSSIVKEYDFICVSAGPSRSNEAKIWSDICDGCYLLVSRKNDNQTLARSAVAELQSFGARLLGCVVTDSEE